MKTNKVTFAMLRSGKEVMKVEQKNSITECVNGVDYVLNIKPSDDVKLSYEDLAKKLITRESMQLEPEKQDQEIDS